MSAPGTASVVPRTPSNRRLIAQASLWGWHPAKVGGDHVILRSPKPGVPTVSVNSPQNHNGTAHRAVMTLARLSGVSIEEFWSRLPNEVSAAYQGEVMLAVTTPAPTPTQEEPTVPAKGSTLPQRRGDISVAVIEALSAAKGEPMSMRQLADATGFTPQQCGHACASLCLPKTGMLTPVERVREGVYRAVPLTGRVEITGNPTIEHRAAEAPPEKLPPQLSVVPDITPDDDDDETVGVMLDLLAPGGYSGRHLKAVLAWREATMELMRSIRGGA